MSIMCICAFPFAVALYVGATVAPLVVLITALVLTMIVVIVTVKRRRRNGAAQRRDEYHANLQSAHDSRVGADEALGGHETIPGIITDKGAAHIQREGLYEELPGDVKMGGQQCEMVDKIMGMKELMKDDVAEKKDCNRQKDHVPVYTMISKTLEGKNNEHDQIKDKETKLDATSNEAKNLPPKMGKTQHPHVQQEEEEREVETDSTDSAPELPPPYISQEELASQHSSDKSGAETPVQHQS